MSNTAIDTLQWAALPFILHRPRPFDPGRRWFLSRAQRNRLQHALHGNGPPSGWREGRQAEQQEKITPRELQDLQSVGRLRAAGWDIPVSVTDDQFLKVYDTRLEGGYLEALHGELGLPGNKDSVLCKIGGDFLTRPFRTDGEALCPTALRRWGPDGDGLYSILVPPRPHLAEWFGRAKQQLALERVQQLALEHG